MAAWASGVISGYMHLPSGAQTPQGKVTGWQANCNILEVAGGRPLIRFPDQILDQRHMQTKSPGPTWLEGQPLSPSPFLTSLSGPCLQPNCNPRVYPPGSAVSTELGSMSTVCNDA